MNCYKSFLRLFITKNPSKGSMGFCKNWNFWFNEEALLN